MTDLFILRKSKFENVYYSINKDYVVSIFYLLMFFIYKITSIVFLFYFSVALLAFFMLICKPEKLLLMMMIFLPSSGLIKLTDGGSALLGYCFLLGEIKYLLFYCKKYKIPYSLIALSICIGVTCLLYLDFSLLLTFFRFFISMVFLCCIMQDKNIVAEIKVKGVDYFVFGTIINILFGIIYYFIIKEPIFSGSFYGVSLDRNFYSAVISVAISFVIIQFLNSRKIAFFAIELIVLLFGGLISGSRTFFVSLIIPALSVLLSLFMKKYIKKAFPFVVSLLVLVVISWNVLSPLINITLDRFKESDVSGGNGRVEIWSFYIDAMKSTPVTMLFGCSSKMNQFISTNHTAHEVAQHNTIIQSLSTIGILGTFFLFLSFLGFFITLWRKQKKNVLFLAPLFSLFLCYFFINGLFSDLLTILIFLCACYNIQKTCDVR